MQKRTFETDAGSVDLFIPDHHKIITVRTSAGTDSTLTLYMVCEYLTEFKREGVTILLTHYLDIVRAPKSLEPMKKIWELFKNRYPNINFVENVISFVEKQRGDKRRLHAKITEKLKTEGVQSFFTGITLNPPLEIQNNLGMTVGRQNHRERENATAYNRYDAYDKDGNETDDYQNCKHLQFRPLLFVDKSFVASMYKQNAFLKNDVFQLTFSCVGNIFDTKNWTIPCKNCWWCKEKKWAFGRYDGELLD